MKRREFISIAAAGAAGMAVPSVGREAGQSRFAFARPRLLHFFGADVVRDLGLLYLETVPAENDAAVLTKTLAASGSPESAGWNVFSNVGAEWSAADLDVLVQRDFAAGRTVILNGWVLSLTEARQCALYSLQPA